MVCVRPSDYILKKEVGNEVDLAMMLEEDDLLDDIVGVLVDHHALDVALNVAVCEELDLRFVVESHDVIQLQNHATPEVAETKGFHMASNFCHYQLQG